VTNVPQQGFPTVEEVMELARSIVNDTFPGIAGTQGRILTDNAPFTLPYLNSAFRKLQRRLRNEGVTFPIRDGVVIFNLPPVVEADPSKFVSLGFNGYNNGTTMFGNLTLPGDCMQVSVVRQRVTGTNLQFTPMKQAEEGLPSAYQNQWLGLWEWRNYQIFMNGSLQPQDIMIRYLSGQPPINIQPAQFATTNIYIIDSQDALANLIAVMYGTARGANKDQLDSAKANAEEAIEEMAQEYIRRQQTVTYNRASYQGAGSSEGNDNSTLGSTGVVS
jgi:hypothetical protein